MEALLYQAIPGVADVRGPRYVRAVSWGNARGLLAILVICGCGALHDDRDVAKSQNRLDIAKDFLRKHELEAAENECNKAIAFNKANDEAYLVRGLVSMVHAVDTQRTMEIDNCLTGVDREATAKDLEVFLEKADADFEHATKISPDYGEAWADRGVAHTLLEDYGAAVG
jgi:tetratricopeptide (TPR) repeat protein